MSFRARAIPLTGADYFALALDRDMRRAGMAGNISRVVVELDGRIDAAQVRAAIDSSGMVSWLAGITWGRVLPFLRPRWRLPRCGGRVPVVEHAAAEGWDPYSPASAAAPGRPAPTSCGLGSARPRLAFDLAQHADATTLTLSWHHGMADAHGAEFLLRHLDAAAGGVARAADALVASAPAATREGANGWLSLPERLRSARRSLSLVDAACRPPIAAIGRRSVGAAPASCFRCIPFSEEQTRRVEARGDRVGAGFRRSLFILAGAIRAVDAVRELRGAEAVAYLVPVPHDRRRPGVCGPVLGNRFSFLFYRAEPGDVRSAEGLVASLRRQMTEQVREGVPGGFAAAMDMFRRVPLGWYARILRGPSGGQFASLFFSDTGESLRGQDSFLGEPITGVVHLPPVRVPPGVAVVCSTFRGRLSVVLSWVEGCLSDEEVALLEARLRAELLGEGER